MVHQVANDAIPLLTPYKMGPFDLHRVVLAPMARCRAYGNVPQPHMAAYYSQRATKGGLLISEATGVSATAHGTQKRPAFGHSSRSTLGGPSSRPSTARVRSSSVRYFTPEGHPQTPDGQAPISSTDKKVMPNAGLAQAGTMYSKPRRLRMDEIPRIVDDFRRAAQNAIEAGFDGVEIHGAHGFLLKQFMKDNANDRTDQYGGSLENRCSFVVEVIDAVVREVGAHRVGIRLSPFMNFRDCIDSDPQALGAYMVQQLNRHLGFLYCHMVEPQMAIIDGHWKIPHRLLPFRKAFNGTFIAAGGYNREEGNKVVADNYTDLVAYGRLFLANPDLPRRFELDALLNKYDRSTFYTHDPIVGYTDYPFLREDHKDLAAPT